MQCIHENCELPIYWKSLCRKHHEARNKRLIRLCTVCKSSYVSSKKTKCRLCSLGFTMFYVYILRKNSRNFYVGSTTNLGRRLSQHAKLRPDYSLVWYVEVPSRILASSIELHLKQLEKRSKTRCEKK